MSIEQLLYKPLTKDEAITDKWKKETVEYVKNHKSQICRNIKTIAKRYNKILQKTDEEDIYMDVIDYMYLNEDYNIVKAFNTEEDRVVSLSGYINSCIMYVVLRYVTNKYNEDKRSRQSIIKHDEEEISIFDLVEDTSAQTEYLSIEYNLNDICRTYEYKRYTYGLDIFQLWYIRLETILQNKKDKYIDVLSILGVQKSSINSINRKSSTDDIMISIAKAISLYGIEKSARILEKYVYGSDRIKLAISQA